MYKTKCQKMKKHEEKRRKILEINAKNIGKIQGKIGKNVQKLEKNLKKKNVNKLRKNSKKKAKNK